MKAGHRPAFSVYVSFPLFDFGIIREVKCVTVFIAVFRVVINFFFIVYDRIVVISVLHLIEFFEDMRIALAHGASVFFFALSVSCESVDHYSHYDHQAKNNKRHKHLLYDEIILYSDELTVNDILCVKNAELTAKTGILFV